MHRSTLPAGAGLFATLAICACSGVAAGADSDYLSLGISYVSPDNGRGSAHGAGGSAGYGREFSDRWAAEGRVFAHTLKPQQGDDPQAGQAGAGLDLLFAPDGAGGFIVLAGLGGVRTSHDADKGFGAFGNIGLGWHDGIAGSALRYRLELRALADQSGPGFSDALFSFVVALPPSLGARPVAAAAPLRVVTLERPVPVVIADADADGIADENDKCASTLRGARVEPDGCVWQEQVVTLSNLLFPSSSDRLTAEIRTRLDEVVRFFANQPEVKMDIFGHTDASGPEALNLKLSKGRAASVRAYLIKKGIAEQRLASDGFGETRPIASNETVEGKATNRRVDLHIHARQPG